MRSIKMRQSRSLLLFSLAIVLSGCSASMMPTHGSSKTENVTTAVTTPLTVFAAASLSDAFTELGANFSAAHPEVTFAFNFAGSQQLAHQLAQGADADLFASANGKQMRVAVEAGRVVSGTAQVFAHNRLVVVLPKENPAQLTTLPDLAKPGLKLVLAAQAAPVGQYSLDFLDKATGDKTLGVGYKEAVLANVVSYEENVKAVLTKVTLGEADAGIVYNSDVALSASVQVQRIEIPDALNTIAAYPIAVINNSAHPEAAQKFVDYLLSPAGQTILVNYGFMREGK